MPGSDQVDTNRGRRTSPVERVGDEMVRTALYEAANILLSRRGDESYGGELAPITTHKVALWAMRDGMGRSNVASSRRGRNRPRPRRTVVASPSYGLLVTLVAGHNCTPHT